MVDYRKFKTPFYELTVMDATMKRKVKLPHHILRLVEKIEFTEVWDNQEKSINTLTLHINEGSREPASPNAELGTKGLYQIPNQGPGVDMNIAGSITNRPGVITDLRFSGSKGITFLSANEAATGQISDQPLENVEGKVVKRLHQGEDTAPQFIFQERNMIELKWGYLEDPNSVRKETFRIMVIRSNFPNNGQIKTTIVAFDDTPELDKVCPTVQSIDFSVQENVTGDEATFDSDLETQDLVKKVCEDSGMACIVSPVIDVPTLDQGRRKIWLVGQSFDQFMRELARRHNAVYKVKFNAVTGKHTLMFVTDKDIATVNITEPHTNAFRYKSAGSIIMSVSVDADFRTLGTSAAVGIDKEGNDNKAINQVVSIEQFQGSGKKNTSFGASSTVTPPPFLEKMIDSILGPENPPANYVEARPEKDTKNVEDITIQNAERMLQRKVKLTMTTLGYTKFHGGTIEISGLGLRYSGKYQIRKATHTIDNSGYVTRVDADTLSLPSGGTVIPSLVEEKLSNLKVELQQFVGIKSEGISRSE